MRVVYLYQYFKTREGYGSTRSYEFVRRLHEAGHDPLVITSTARLPKMTGVRSWGLIQGKVDGIDIWAVPSRYSNRMGFARRIFEFLRFAIVSSLAVLRVRRPDLIFASSTPLTIAIPALVGRIVRSIPLVFEVRDLWPEVPIGMGILRTGVIISLAKGLARITYRHSTRIIALSPGMKEGIVRYRIEPERIVVIPNGSDLDLFRPDMDGSHVRVQLALDKSSYLIVHTGAMGLVNGLEFLVPVCLDLQTRLKRAVVYLVGDGSQRQKLEAMAAEAGLHNLHFIDPIPKKEMPGWLAAADLGLMVIRRIPILEMNSANKFFDYAAAGLPCLMNYGGWKADLLRRYRAGEAVDTDDPAAFVEAIVTLANDSDRSREMSRNARTMAEVEFDRDRHFRILVECLLQAAGRPQLDPAPEGGD